MFQGWTFSLFQWFKLVIATCLKSDYSPQFSDSRWWLNSTCLKSEHFHNFSSAGWCLLLVWRVYILTVSTIRAGDCYLFEEWLFSPFQWFELVIATGLKREHSHRFSNADWWLLLVWGLNILTISAIHAGDYYLLEEGTFSLFQRFELVTTTCLKRELRYPWTKAWMNNAQSPARWPSDNRNKRAQRDWDLSR